MASYDTTPTTTTPQLEIRSDSTSRSEIYEHLRSNEIRLAEVKASYDDEDEPVVCRLLTFSRDSAPIYNALSYCWGPPEERGTSSIIIELRSKQVRWPVTPTLEMALCRLRRKDGRTPLLIWADALCINQEDELEKGHQVQEMRHVYQNAREVSIWLGPVDEDSPFAWSLINDIYFGGQDPTDLFTFNDGQFRSLQNLFRREYFWRIWIIQEIACAKDARVYCGPNSMPWSRLLSVSNKLDEIRDNHYESRSALVFLMMRGGPGILKATASSVTQYARERPQPLLDLLCSHMIKGSSDPRDKVYGLVGISADQASFGKISYERSTRDLFIHTTRYIITTTQELNVICLKQNEDNLHNLPSWVVDWERRQRYPSFGPKPLYIRKPSFAASLKEKAILGFSPDGVTLIARGFLLDTIKSMGQEFQDLGPGTLLNKNVRARHCLRIFHNWWSIFADQIGIEYHQNFQRTFCGGAWAPPDSEFEHDVSQRLSFFFGLMRKLLPELDIDDTVLPSLLDVSNIEARALEARQYALVFSASRRMHGKRFVLTSTGLAGLAPQATQAGDHVVVLLGCDFPVVMRAVDTHWILIGEIYVDGIMYGEAMDRLAAGKYITRDFEMR